MSNNPEGEDSLAHVEAEVVEQLEAEALAPVPALGDKELEVAQPQNKDDQVVTPWTAQCGANGFDYDRLIKQFGVEPITQELLDRFEKVTGHKPHAWLRRGIFFAHRQLSEILDDVENGKKVFLYTGRGPTSEALHLGHMIPFIFTKWLQDVLNAVVVIQMADDEKYYFKDMDFKTVYDLQFENVKDILACGFNPEKTFIFSNRDYTKMPWVHDMVHTMFKEVNINTIKAIFGIPDNACFGQLLWPIYQTAASYSPYFDFLFGSTENVRCLVAYAIDQDPYFRLARDLAPKMGNPETGNPKGYFKPCSIMTQFLPALEGKAKMSSTVGDKRQTETPETAPTIFMNDPPSWISNKIKKYAFSGGKQTLEEHRRLGGDLDVDISYQYLRYFLYDDERLEEIGKAYSSGAMLTSELKKILSDVLTELVVEHQKRRNAVTKEQIEEVYKMRAM